MIADAERISLNQAALSRSGLAAAVWALPSNVLLWSGYWPVVGQSVAICVRDGPTVIVAPKDEAHLAGKGFADLIETFEPLPLGKMRSVLRAIEPVLEEVLSKVQLPDGPIGVEAGGTDEAFPYLAGHLYGNELEILLRRCCRSREIVPVGGWLEELRAVRTSAEMAKLRKACAIAKDAFESTAREMRVGMTECEVAGPFRALLNGPHETENLRADGFAFCMAGPNSAKASAAFARSRHRKLEKNDLVMLHCNSYLDGFWTDITRTYTLQEPDERQERMFAAVHAARKAALEMIQPGVRAEAIDAMARSVLSEHGWAKEIRHGTGHGVGLSAMSAYAIPRLHAGSPDILEEGMVFNVEPAVYLEGYGGARHCDMVAVTKDGYELLTDFHVEARNARAVSVSATF